MRDMEARFTGLCRELESHIGKPVFADMWGTEKSEAELVLLRLQDRAAVAAPSAEATKRRSTPVRSGSNLAVRPCAEVFGEFVYTASLWAAMKLVVSEAKDI